MSERDWVMRRLADWIKKNGWQVYYNQKNDDYPVFRANTNSKPDLLITKNNYNIMIEVKNGQEHQDILNGFDQTIKYAGEYYTGRIRYKTVNQENIPINAFLLATDTSHNGYLYANESELNYLTYGWLTETYNMIEKPITHTLTRLLWRTWQKGLACKTYELLRQGNKNIKLPKKPFIGVLLSKTLASTNETSIEPYAYMNSNEFISLKYNEIKCFES